VNNYKDATTPSPLAARLRNGARALAALALLMVGLVIAGCGSSGGSGTITIGNENKADDALIHAGESEEVKTPKSGPLSEEPKVTVPKEPAPKTLSTKDIITGTGTEAKSGDKVTVNYVGALYKNGSVFDASWKRKEPFSFTIGTKEVIPGWEQGVVGMKVGGRRELIIPSELAYGKAGSPPKIGANEPLIFIVDLLKA
jgi:peptidylprolyl isomerase